MLFIGHVTMLWVRETEKKGDSDADGSNVMGGGISEGSKLEGEERHS